MDTKQMLDGALDIAKWIAIGGAAYVGTLVGVQMWDIKRSEKINSTEQLEKIVDEERKKLNINKPFSVILFNSTAAGIAIPKESANPILCVGGETATRGVVKHELYHYFKKHNVREGILGRLNYWLRQEPQATLYETLGIKL